MLVQPSFRSLVEASFPNFSNGATGARPWGSPPPASGASGGKGLRGQFENIDPQPPTRLGAPHLATLPTASRGEGERLITRRAAGRGPRRAAPWPWCLRAARCRPDI